MRLRYVVRELWHHRLRTGLALVGVSVATAMLLDMLMLSGGLETSFRRLLSSRGYAIRIAPVGTIPFESEALIPSYPTLRDTLLDVPGVVGVAPLLGANVELRAGADSARAFALGIDPAEQGVYRLLAGDPPAEGRVVVDEGLARDAGLAIGTRIELELAGSLGVARRVNVRVAGVAEFVYSARGERVVALPLPVLQRLAGRGDRIAFAMVRISDTADPEAVGAAIRARAPRVETFTVSGLVERARARLSYFRQLSIILGSVATAVTALLVGTIMAVSINDRYGTIAAMRALGISRRTVVASFTGESLVLSAAGAGLGVGLGVLTAGYLEGVLAGFPGLPAGIRFFVLDGPAVGRAIAIVLGVGAVAGLVPAWRVANLEISRTLHREEP